jgi:hypothetical protein
VEQWTPAAKLFMKLVLGLFEKPVERISVS